MKTLTLRTKNDVLIIPKDSSVVESIFVNNVIDFTDLVFKSEQERSKLCQFLFLIATKDSLKNRQKDGENISPLAHSARELVRGAN